MTAGAAEFPAGRDWRGAIARLPAAAGAAFLAEREQWALWLPVALGAGIAGYFALPGEPPWWTGPVLALAGAGAAWFAGPARLAAFLLACALAAAGLGFAAAQFRTHQAATPMLAERLGPVEVRGRVVDRETLADGSRRVVLDRLAIAGLKPETTPRRVRVRMNERHGAETEIGALIALPAVLMPASPPLAPGAFDFQRNAFFQGIGAVGFSVGAARTLEAAAPYSPGLMLERLREDVGARIRAGVGGPGDKSRGDAAAPLAAALLIGDRAGIPEPVLSAMRDSGLAHLIAISGLNFALVAGMLFFVVRGLLCLSEYLALHHPVKKWAAAIAFLGAAFYFLVAGPSPPTERAFLMIGVVLLGVLADREAISMRLVAWAAAAILLVLPESLLGASFQMSFAAVIALVAAYEALRGRFHDLRAELGAWGKAGLYLGAVVLTTVIGSAATGIYAAYHFNRFPLYGLAANLIAVPVTAHWIMPWGMLAFALMPFGLEHWALVPMGWGARVVIWTAETVASWPGAVAALPAMPFWGLAAATLGGLWLCLWRGRWRAWGAVPVALGLLSMAVARGPDILVSGDARMMAVRGGDGLLRLWSPGRPGRLTAETWLRRAGQRDTADWPRPGERAEWNNGSSLACDRQACIYRRDGKTAALIRDPGAAAEDCARADVVVGAVPLRRGALGRSCAGAALVIDRFDLWRGGAHALWLDGAAPRVESVGAERGERPWVAKREPRRR
jgi:competence protein ComEC